MREGRGREEGGREQEKYVPRPLGTIVLATSRILPNAPSVVKSGWTG